MCLPRVIYASGPGFHGRSVSLTPRSVSECSRQPPIPRRAYALAGRNRKLLVALTFLTTAQFTLGIALIVQSRILSAREEPSWRESFRRINPTSPHSVGPPFHAGCHFLDLHDASQDHSGVPGVLRLVFRSLWSGIPPLDSLRVSKLSPTDTVLFLTVIGSSYLTCGPRSNWPNLLRAIVRDSGLYFLVVFFSHVSVIPHLTTYFSPM